MKMDPTRKTSMNRSLGITLVLICLLMPIIDFCSTYMTARRTSKKIARETKNIVTFNETLRKYIGLVRVENWTYYDRDDIDVVFQNQLSEILLSACPKLLLAKPQDDTYPEFLRNLPPRVAGQVDNIGLALLGRQHGLDAIVTAAVVNISAYQELRGIVWLRDTYAYMQIQFLVEVFDTQTGAKLLSENYIHEVEIDEGDLEFIKEKKPVTLVQIPETVKYVASILGEKTCDAISGEPWKSYIVSIDGNTVTIASGANAGLEVGMELNAFDPGRLIKGIKDQQFFLPGSVVGEIKVTKVHPSRAEATMVENNGIQVGSPVRLQ
jgi:hypothetical protein